MMRIHQPSNSLSLVKYVDKYGAKRDSERGETTEVIGSALRVRNPRNRLDVTRTRRMNPAFAFAEFISVMYGIDDIDYFTQLIPGYTRFSSDGEKLDGAYGTRIQKDGASSQFSEAIKVLRKKPSSRRAVISIYEDDDLLHGKGGLNTPCTLNLQLLQNAASGLDMVAYMRSSDIYLGLPNDIVVFTMMQEYAANLLGWPLGEYTHFAGSLHYYEGDNLHAKLGMVEAEGRWPYIMEPMPATANLEMLKPVFENLMTEEGIEALGRIDHQYTRNIGLVAMAIARRTTEREFAANLYSDITDKTLKRVTFPWLQKEA